MSFKKLEGKDREVQKLPEGAVTMVGEPSRGADGGGAPDGIDGDTLSCWVPRGIEKDG